MKLSDLIDHLYCTAFGLGIALFVIYDWTFCLPALGDPRAPWSPTRWLMGLLWELGGSR